MQPPTDPQLLEALERLVAALEADLGSVGASVVLAVVGAGAPLLVAKLFPRRNRRHLAAAGRARDRKGLELLVRCARGHLPEGAIQTRVGQLNRDKKPWREIGETLEAEWARRAAPASWAEVEASYRVWLYHAGHDGSDDPRSRERHRDRGGFDPVRVQAEFERRGAVPVADRLRRRMRTFSRGAGFGSPEFLETLLGAYRSCFGPKRARAGRKLPGGWMGLESLRQAD